MASEKTFVASMSRRGFMGGVVAVAGAGLAAPAFASGQQAASAPLLGARLTFRTFATPPRADAPWVRWPLAPAVTDAELETELTEMARAGIFGAEIGQGTFPPIAQVATILRKANELGITISLSHGPVAAPEGFTVDDENARKSVVHGAVKLAGGTSFSGVLPAPSTENRLTLIAVIAYRITGTWSTTATTTLDLDSATDLTGKVTDRDTRGVQGGTSSGRLTWTAPTGGDWALIAVYGVGTIAQPDLLTVAGRRVLTQVMDQEFAPIKSLLRKNAGDLFYDSHTGDRGSPNDTWSNTLAADFRKANGYSLVPYLPALTTLPTSGFGAALPGFTFGATITAKFTNDFAQTRTDVWLRTQVLALQEWAKKYNQKIRLQPYGQNGPAVDSIQAAAVLDKVETETLWFGDVVDNYLPEASAVHMTGRTWYSIEASAVLQGAYAMTWQDQVVHMNKAYAGGVTKLVSHIYPYADSSTSVWPGFSLFPDSFGNSWGPRSPHWKDAARYNAYFARTQQVLAQGTAQRDVAVYMQNYVYPQPYLYENLQYWSDAGLERSGYTRDYLNPTLLALPNAIVTNGRLAEKGPGYKVLILDGQQLPTSAASRSAMDVATARRVLALAKAGLPVVVVGSAPASSPGIDADADATVQKLMKQLLAQRGVHVVARQSEVPALLTKLGIRPDAQPAEAGPVLTVHRKDNGADFYWFYNQGSVISPKTPANTYDPATGSPVSATFTLAGRGTPLRLNPWDGSVTPIERYTTGKGTVTVSLDLAPEDTAIVVLTTDPSRFGQKSRALHVVSTTADAVVPGKDGAIVIAAAAAGSYSTTLSNGRVVHSKIGALPRAIDLTGTTWTLNAEDWQPASAYGTTGPAATKTTKKAVSVRLAALKPWPQIPELTDASGIGVYTSTFQLDATWKAVQSATLSLGSVTDSFTVTINGRTVDFVNQLSASAEIGSHLKQGANTLEVTVSTTLINRLRTLNKTQGTWPVQANGLVGPVTITPRGTATVA
ncbi:glycosyl hydrolase [Kineosporia succinea]|uniref:Secreted protein n=1 Tax=Kineosporia succinea TaxID=84632 RepID=A0ABT9P9Y6_9ACTN|nr:glycosyl hydrolase [Kineosporia succinea]MDP9829507.1 hypothetical protein [Kineosporia succinea]